MNTTRQRDEPSSDTPRVVIHLTDERYARLVVGVDDPARTVAAIRQALSS